MIVAPDRCYLRDVSGLEARLDTRWRTDTGEAAMAGGNGAEKTHQTHSEQVISGMNTIKCRPGIIAQAIGAQR